MMQLEILGGAQTESVDVSDAAFNRDFNEALVHQVVTAYLAGRRVGSKAQKTRSDTRGGGAKPWRQKGTGRARAGSNRSPLWRGGGKIFAARPRSHSQKVNRKMYRGAMCAIFSELVRQKRFVVLEALKLDTPRTKDLLAKLESFNACEGLVLVENIDENLALAARNVVALQVCAVEAVDPASLVRFDKVIATVAAVRHLEKWLAHD